MSGLEWSSNDLWDPARLNKKTRFVGTGEQATTFITDPVVGQCVFSTETDATFQIDKTHFRNSADSAWVSNKLTNAEYTTSPDDTNVINYTTGSPDSNNRKYQFLTLPSTYDIYLITHLEVVFYEVFIDGTGTFSAMWGVDLVDANPPTKTYAPLVALAQGPVTHTDITPTDQYITFKRKCMSKPLKAGDILGIWINTTRTAGGDSWKIKAANDLGTKYYRTETYTTTPPTALDATWSTESQRTNAIKVYAQGYKSS